MSPSHKSLKKPSTLNTTGWRWRKQGVGPRHFYFNLCFPPGINTGANRQCSATAADKGLAEDVPLFIWTRLWHRAPKLLKPCSSEVSQGSARITPTSCLSMPVCHYRKPRGKTTSAHPAVKWKWTMKSWPRNNSPFIRQSCSSHTHQSQTYKQAKSQLWLQRELPIK